MNQNFTDILGVYSEKYSFFLIGNKPYGCISNNPSVSILVEGRNHKISYKDIQTIKRSFEKKLPFKVYLLSNLNKRFFLYLQNNMLFIPINLYPHKHAQ